MDIKVLLEAVARPWFIEPQAAGYYNSIVHALVNRADVSAFIEKPLELSYAVDITGQRTGTVAEANGEGVAVINMRGPVMKYDFCGTPGTQSMMKALAEANDNPAIKGIILQIDSPGGSVDGTEQFAAAVKASKKPVVAYANGMMASAAMWIGSAASTRISSSATNIIGSIGTMMKFKDTTKADAAQGVESHEVYATNSTHKNHGFRELQSTGSYDAIRAEVLDPLNDEFTAAIQANLPGVDPVVLNGSTYLGKEAKRKGLIDKIGSFDSAVKSVLQLAKNSKTSMENITPFASTLAAANAEAFAVTDEGFALSEEQLTSIEQSLVKYDADLATAAETIALAGEKFSSMENQLIEATQALDATNEQLATANNRILELESANGSSAADTSTDADAFTGGATGFDKYKTSADAEMEKMRQLAKS